MKIQTWTVRASFPTKKWQIRSRFLQKIKVANSKREKFLYRLLEGGTRNLFTSKYFKKAVHSFYTHAFSNACTFCQKEDVNNHVFKSGYTLHNNPDMSFNF